MQSILQGLADHSLVTISMGYVNWTINNAYNNPGTPKHIVFGYLRGTAFCFFYESIDEVLAARRLSAKACRPYNFAGPFVGALSQE
jgi:hypothetical protein